MMPARFWEHVHLRGDRRYLTGSIPDDVFSLHDLHGMLTGGPLRVMDVGVGFGNLALRLRALGHTVVAVDIAVSALRKLRYHAETVLVEDLLRHTMAPVDVAICHLVAQHCDDAAFRTLLTAIFAHLKPAAFLSLQFAERIEGDLEPRFQEEEAMGLCVWRSVADVERAALAAGGRLAVVSEPFHLHTTRSLVWRVARLRAATC